MFSETQPTTPVTDYSVNLFEDESHDHANRWDGESLRALAAPRDESNDAANTAVRVTMRA